MGCCPQRGLSSNSHGTANLPDGLLGKGSAASRSVSPPKACRPFPHLHMKPLALSACTINCFGRKSFQIQGRWFSLMWSTFQRTHLLTILLNESVLQALAAQAPVNHLVLIFIQAPLLGLALLWSKARPFLWAHSQPELEAL